MAQPPPRKKLSKKQAATAMFIGSTDEDRIRSKAKYDELTFFHGAPSTRSRQETWVARFEAFRTHTLGHNLKEPFTGEDLVRFFTTMITKLRPYQQDIPVPVRQTLDEGKRILVKYGDFHWTNNDGYHVTKQDHLKYEIMIDNAVRAGELKTGHQNPRAWIGYQVVARLIKRFIDSAHKYGVRNWDVTICQISSIVLIASTMARSGDLTLGPGYDASSGFFLRWRDLEASIEGSVAILSKLRIVVRLRNTKNHKGQDNDDILRLLTPFPDDSTEHALDPCRWILILAMRTGQIKHELQDVLNDALQRPDHQIVWFNPEFPVIPTRSKSSTHLKLEEPAREHQVLITMKEMAANAGMIGRAYVHGLRYGAARDINHIPRSKLDGMGFSDEYTRQALAHNPHAQMHGTTDLYSGETTALLWNLRAEHAGYADPRRPKFIEDVSIPSAPQHAASQRVHTKGSRRTQTRKKEQETTPIEDNIAVDNESMAFLQACTSLGDEDPSCEGVLGQNDSREQGSAIDAITEEMLDDTAVMNAASTTSNDFIENYATINIVKNDAWHQEYLKFNNQHIPFSPEIAAVYSTHDAIQHGKDIPTPYIFTCEATIGCTYSTVHASAFSNHEQLCNDDLVSTRQDGANAREAGLGLACPRDGCTQILANSQSLKNHIKGMHDDDWTPKACEHGCNPDKQFDKRRGYETHQARYHPADAAQRFPTKCVVPDCTDTVTYHQLAKLRRHLVNDHEIPADDEEHLRMYLPKTGSTMDVWMKEQPCPTIVTEGTSCELYKFGSKEDMRRHLMAGTHRLTESEANEVIDEHAQRETKERKVRIHKTSKVSHEGVDAHNGTSVAKPELRTRARGKLPSTTTSNNGQSDDEEDEIITHKPTRTKRQPVTTAQRKPMTRARFQARTMTSDTKNGNSESDDEEDKIITHKPTRTKRQVYDSDDEFNIQGKVGPKKRAKFPTPETSFDE